MSDEESAAELRKLREWLSSQGAEPMTAAEVCQTAGSYMRLGWRPNGSEGLRFLATTMAAFEAPTP